MDYPEFHAYTEYQDSENTLVHRYKNDAGDVFYVEPGFYDALLGFREKRAERFDELMTAIDTVIRENHQVIFTTDFENPWITREGFIYREIFDLTDPLHIIVEDKSRGSDYGD